MTGNGLWLLVLACAGSKHSPEPAPEPLPATVPTPSASQEALHKALSARDTGPECAELETLSETPVEDLVWLTEHASSPPWVGTRAATCLLLGHGDAVADQLRDWVTDPTQAGFGAIVLNNLGVIDCALAVELATLALTEGPDPEGARTRIAQHEVPELQALLQEL